MALPEIIRQLLENGVHFGHLSKHWNPKMKKFIFGKKKNIYIIDLEKTAQKLEEAREFLKSVAQNRGKILFVSTKRQLREVIKELAVMCDMPYVCERWVGGFLTNFATIRERIKKYITLKEKREAGEFEKMPHKEVVRLNKELERMERMYSGTVSLEELPQCVYIVDPKREIACVREANKLSIPIVALIDTDADPEVIDYPIPGNDDAIKSVKFITQYLVKGILEGLEKLDRPTPKSEEKQDTHSSSEEGK
ncbi:MAG: 30S ribosomal protein S2 [Candidatus Omnitrophica bacterium]|nr:30S ribosomal protein S2 [Candidatus Omnitrophota bacterium]